jgi:SOUL heme-binding protein
MMRFTTLRHTADLARHSVQIVCTIFLLTLFIAGDVMAIEEPAYQVLVSDAPFEHRRYSGFVVAETLLSGDFDSASQTGFRRVAAYIFGDNTAEAGKSRKISMTAPVTVSPAESGWKLHFVMPSQEKLDTLPRPNNSQINLRKVNEHEVVAIRFSGWTTAASIRENTEKLQQWASARQLTLAGVPQVARYNDPFTLPWRRRNEILIEVSR